jgi:hypothetical protein
MPYGDNPSGINYSLSPRRGERAGVGGEKTACNFLTGHCWDLGGFKAILKSYINKVSFLK